MAINEISYDSKKASRMLILVAIPMSSSLIYIFYIIWGDIIDFAQALNIIQEKLFLSIIIFFISVALHEGLHALAYLILDNWHYKNLSFGLSKTLFSPYCHYSNSVLLWKYRLSLILPGLILGFIPLMLSFLLGKFYLLIYGIIFTLGAFGDFLILWKLRKFRFNAIVKDNPNKMGCILEK